MLGLILFLIFKVKFSMHFLHHLTINLLRFFIKSLWIILVYQFNPHLIPQNFHLSMNLVIITLNLIHFKIFVIEFR